MTLNVGVFGAEDAGKTTFAGLLYSAHIDLSNKPDKRREFRFYSTPSQLRVMQGIYTQLRSGDWPEVPQGVSRITCSYEYPTSTSLLSKMLGRSDHATNSINFNIYLLPMEELRKSGIFRDALASDVFVFLLDISKIAIESGQVIPFSEDLTICSLLSMGAERAGQRGAEIIFVLTKFDFVDSETLAALSIPKDPPPLADRPARQEYVNKLMTKICPETMRLLRKDARVSGALRDPIHFFSSVRTVFDENGDVVPKLKRMKGSANFELDYSYEEYEGLIMRMAEIAGERSRR
ncbi:MAG: hypothetical protein AB1665_07315 [Candidatus Thermoplasmatota archaeon]